jgi:hypothetical protein
MFPRYHLRTVLYILFKDALKRHYRIITLPHTPQPYFVVLSTHTISSHLPLMPSGTAQSSETVFQ